MASASGSSSCGDSEKSAIFNQAKMESQDDTMTKKSAPETPENFLRCIQMLKTAHTDTEKFAALLVVTKLVKAEELNFTCRSRLLETIGIPFLSRMLRSTETPDGCPPFMYKSIALTIITCFIPCCHGNPALYSLIPVIGEIVCDATTYGESLTLIKDAFQFLEYIALNEAGRRSIIDAQLFAPLVRTYTDGHFCSDQALKILYAMLLDDSLKLWEKDSDTFALLMASICDDFVIDQNEHKFYLCVVLSKILDRLPTAYFERQEGNCWWSQIHKGLADIIFSKLGQKERKRGLQLAASVMENLGLPWIITTGERGRQLLLMIVHLACIEVRMSLEDRSFEEAVYVAEQTTFCYSILEGAINFLVNGALELEEKQKQQLYAALKGAFTAVVTFLKQLTAEKVHSTSPQPQMFICATIRVLGAWLAEETTTNKKEVYELLPLLIHVSRYNFEWNTKNLEENVDADEKQGTEKLPDIFQFLLPGLCHFTAEYIPRHILLDLDIENFMFIYLTNHWNCCKKQFHLIKTGQEVVNSNHSLDTMVTICNIFMNIVVQEPERVREEKFYYMLLKFIFGAVPELPAENRFLHLCGSFCTLGLMILRHQQKNIKCSDFAILRFVQVTVRFLWDAHNVEESHDYATLTVSSRYKPSWNDLMELWFLGMHTFTYLLPSIPWMCDFVVESEWPQNIISTLTGVREGGIDPGLKTTIEEFLCVLAQSSKPALTLLKASGMRDVCQAHKFDDLSKILYGK